MGDPWGQGYVGTSLLKWENSGFKHSRDLERGMGRLEQVPSSHSLSSHLLTLSSNSGHVYTDEQQAILRRHLQRGNLQHRRH